MDTTPDHASPSPMRESSSKPTFLEFFAGGGMVRAGLGDGWRCLFANDIDPAKAAIYPDNWGAAELHVADVAGISADRVPGRADLAWGSFPCQDLSLAGAGAGLDGGRSGMFHAFWRVIADLARAGRAPTLVAVENVCGSLTSQGGRDFAAICQAFVTHGYRPGAMVINADRFLPQSRPRLFVIGQHRDWSLPGAVTGAAPSRPFHPPALTRAIAALPEHLRAEMRWWNLPVPEPTTVTLSDLIDPNDGRLHTTAQTQRLLSQMSLVNQAKVEAAVRYGRRQTGAVFRRTRTEDGHRVQRAEIRFDQAGCLRTSAGGSSRQIVLIVDGPDIRSRLMTPRETARLMGLGDTYRLPASATAGLNLTGDGVAVPVVRHLAAHLFEPMLASATGLARAA